MKKAGKFAVAALAAVLAVSAACFAFAACGESAPELTDTYQSQARLKYFTCAEDRDFWISEAYTVELYSDGTYVCAINITESQQKLANFEYSDTESNVIAPLAVTAFTREGTYTMTTDDSVGSFSLTLGKATRVTFSTNAGGGHYPVVPTNNVMYVDSNDAEATAAFETEWYGDWEELEALVGAEVTLTGSTSTHMFDAGQMVFEYKSPMFVTLLGLEIY